jgi:DNA-binding GntR family transcriptional regulator
MTVPFAPAKSAAIRRTVLEALHHALITGRFAPGQEVSDAALAAEFQVSRGPVREALLILAEEGLLRHKHNRGFVVPTLTQEDLQQIVRVREPLEISSLEDARQRVTPEDLARLAVKQKAIDDAFASGGSANCSVSEYDFHGDIWDLAGNSWRAAALRLVCRPYFTYVSAFQLGRRDMTGDLLHRQHTMYLQYLAGEIPQSAAECVHFHLDLGSRGAGS